MGHQPTKSVEDKTRIVLAVLRGEVSIAEAARREGTSTVSISKWRDQFLAGGQGALEAGGRSGPSSREQQLAAEIEQLNTALGEAHMELRLWKKGGSLYGASTNSTASARRHT
jgi:transposase